MRYPELRYSQAAYDRFHFVIPKLGFQALADAVELDTSRLDSFRLALYDRDSSSRLARLGTYTYEKFQHSKGSVTREGTVAVYLGQFVGYGLHSLSINFGIVEDMSSEEIDDMNFSAVVLHELMHLNRIETLEKGEPIPYLPSGLKATPYLFGMNTYTADPEEKYVLYQTYKLLEERPELCSALHVSVKK